VEGRRVGTRGITRGLHTVLETSSDSISVGGQQQLANEGFQDGRGHLGMTRAGNEIVREERRDARRSGSGSNLAQLEVVGEIEALHVILDQAFDLRLLLIREARTGRGREATGGANSGGQREASGVRRSRRLPGAAEYHASVLLGDIAVDVRMSSTDHHHGVVRCDAGRQERHLREDGADETQARVNNVEKATRSSIDGGVSAKGSPTTGRGDQLPFKDGETDRLPVAVVRASGVDDGETSSRGQRSELGASAAEVFDADVAYPLIRTDEGVRGRRLRQAHACAPTADVAEESGGRTVGSDGSIPQGMREREYHGGSLDKETQEQGNEGTRVRGDKRGV
jgi:hypothetical protein